MEIYEKRGRWVLIDDNGKKRKFSTENEAKLFAGIVEKSELAPQPEKPELVPQPEWKGLITEED